MLWNWDVKNKYCTYYNFVQPRKNIGKYRIIYIVPSDISQVQHSSSLLVLCARKFSQTQSICQALHFPTAVHSLLFFEGIALYILSLGGARRFPVQNSSCFSFAVCVSSLSGELRIFPSSGPIVGEAPSRRMNTSIEISSVCARSHPLPLIHAPPVYDVLAGLSARIKIQYFI